MEVRACLTSKENEEKINNIIDKHEKIILWRHTNE
jgi:hypothetical protein